MKTLFHVHLPPATRFVSACCFSAFLPLRRFPPPRRIFSPLASHDSFPPSLEAEDAPLSSSVVSALPFPPLQSSSEDRSFSDGTMSASRWHSCWLENVEKDIERIESMLNSSKEENNDVDSFPNSILELQCKLHTLTHEHSQMEAQLVSREDNLNIALQETKRLKNDLRDAEQRVSFLNIYKEVNISKQAEEMKMLEKSSCDSVLTLDKHFVENQALSYTQEVVRNLWETIVQSSQHSSIIRAFEVLRKDASLSFEALSLANEKLEVEKNLSNDLLLKWKKAAEDLQVKEFQLAKLNKELTDTKTYGENILKAHSRAEAEIQTLRKKLVITEQSLEKEKKALFAAREGLEKLDKALEEEESRVEDLFQEVSYLKLQLEQKQKVVEELKQVTVKNKNLAETLRRNRDVLHQSEKRIEQLVTQCNVLENQIKSRDALLEEIKEEALKSARSLQLAAQIKQDLNEAREREIDLKQQLEGQTAYVEELKQKLEENSRAVRAEQALWKAEKNAVDLAKEVDILKKGIQSRDDVIKLMQERIDGNIRVLKSASADREAMKKLQVYVSELESKVKGFMVQQ